MKIIIPILLVSSPLFSKTISLSDLGVGKEIPQVKARPVLTTTIDVSGDFTPKKPHWHSDPGHYKFINDYQQNWSQMNQTRTMMHNHASRSRY